MTFSIVSIVPVSLASDASRVAWALGHGTGPADSYLVALSPDGKSKATHVGLHTSGDQSVVDSMTAAPVGIVWADFGMTKARADAVFAAAILSAVDAATSYGAAHFDNVLAANGLKRIGWSIA